MIRKVYHPLLLLLPLVLELRCFGAPVFWHYNALLHSTASSVRYISYVTHSQKPPKQFCLFAFRILLGPLWACIYKVYRLLFNIVHLFLPSLPLLLSCLFVSSSVPFLVAWFLLVFGSISIRTNIAFGCEHPRAREAHFTICTYSNLIFVLKIFNVVFTVFIVLAELPSKYGRSARRGQTHKEVRNGTQQPST